MKKRLHTLCVKDATDHRTTKPHQLPIYATSSFESETVEESMDIFKDPTKGHLYARFNNPTVDAVAAKIASLESYNTDVNDAWGIMTSSGMSAITTLLLSKLKSGDKILTQGNLYGGTTELIKNRIPQYGIQCILTDLTDTSSVQRMLNDHKEIKLVYFETPSNPALDCIDIAAVNKIAHDYNAVTVIDNTFCTPIIQQPFKYATDYIIHSTTKYMNGHGNSISGIIIGNSKERYNEVWNTMKLLGTNCNAWDAWLLNNGMKTLAIRMDKHSSNALELAQFLYSHTKVKSVNYLGLENHPHHVLASKQMSTYGGMLCFEVEGDYNSGIHFMNALEIGCLAPTMGDIDTLLMHPASMSHLNVDPLIRQENGISDTLIRVSVGLEDIEDLKEDFDRALNN